MDKLVRVNSNRLFGFNDKILFGYSKDTLQRNAFSDALAPKKIPHRLNPSEKPLKGRMLGAFKPSELFEMERERAA